MNNQQSKGFYINGQWQSPVSEQSFATINPATGIKVMQLDRFDLK